MLKPWALNHHIVGKDEGYLAVVDDDYEEFNDDKDS